MTQIAAAPPVVRRPVRTLMLRIPAALHRELRHRAVEEDRPAAEIVREVVERYLRDVTTA